MRNIVDGSDVNEMKIKRRLRMKPTQMKPKKSPEVKIKAINALYGSENTLESLRASKKANKAVVFAVEP